MAHPSPSLKSTFSLFLKIFPQFSKKIPNFRTFFLFFSKLSNDGCNRGLLRARTRELWVLQSPTCEVLKSPPSSYKCQVPSEFKYYLESKTFHNLPLILCCSLFRYSFRFFSFRFVNNFYFFDFLFDLCDGRRENWRISEIFDFALDLIQGPKETT